jgi:hypothetical protein
MKPRGDGGAADGTNAGAAGELRRHYAVHGHHPTPTGHEHHREPSHRRPPCSADAHLHSRGKPWCGCAWAPVEPAWPRLPWCWGGGRTRMAAAVVPLRRHRYSHSCGQSWCGGGGRTCAAAVCRAAASAAVPAQLRAVVPLGRHGWAQWHPVGAGKRDQPRTAPRRAPRERSSARTFTPGTPPVQPSDANPPSAQAPDTTTAPGTPDPAPAYAHPHTPTLRGPRTP